VVSRKYLATKVGAQEKANRDRKSLVNLLIVSAMYLVFMTPSTVTWTCYILAITHSRSLDLGYTELLDQLGALFHQWSIMNYCFNFIVYSISLTFYREELKVITGTLLCRR
jgi:hypothetical protein